MEKKTPNKILSWPDNIRLKMIEKSEYYSPNEKIYQFGFYDGYQINNQETAELRKDLKESEDTVIKLTAMCADKDREIERLNKENETLTILVNNPRYTPKGGF